MSYTKTNWQNDDIIGAEELNNMEDGIYNNDAAAAAAASAAAAAEQVVVPFTLTEVDDQLVCSTTAIFANVVAAVEAGNPVVGEVELELDDGSVVFRLPLCDYLTDNEDSIAALMFGNVIDSGNEDDGHDVNLYKILFTAESCSAEVTPVELKEDSAQVVKVPFTLTYDDQNDTWAGTTTASFSDIIAAAKAGSVIVCDGISTMLGIASHYIGVMNLIDAGDSQYTEDELSVVIPFKANSTTIAGMYIKWLAASVTVKQYTIATVT